MDGELLGSTVKLRVNITTFDYLLFCLLVLINSFTLFFFPPYCNFNLGIIFLLPKSFLFRIYFSKDLFLVVLSEKVSFLPSDIYGVFRSKSTIHDSSQCKLKLFIFSRKGVLKSLGWWSFSYSVLLYLIFCCSNFNLDLEGRQTYSYSWLYWIGVVFSHVCIFLIVYW